jgi:hypothetical protein
MLLFLSNSMVTYFMITGQVYHNAVIAPDAGTGDNHAFHGFEYFQGIDSMDMKRRHAAAFARLIGFVYYSGGPELP